MNVSYLIVRDANEDHKAPVLMTERLYHSRVKASEDLIKIMRELDLYGEDFYKALPEDFDEMPPILQCNIIEGMSPDQLRVMPVTYAD